MACADIPMEIQGGNGDNERDLRRLLIKHYKAMELEPCAKRPLDDLLKKEPAVLGSLQLISGLMSFGVGVWFAVNQVMNQSLLMLFRVPLLTGSLFFIAGLLSNLLFKFPRLLPVCMFANICSIIVAMVGAVLISVDFAVSQPSLVYLKMEILLFCVLIMEIVISAVLVKFIKAEHCSLSL